MGSGRPEKLPSFGEDQGFSLDISPPNQSVERDFGLPAPLRSAANPKQLTLNVLRTEYGSEPYVI